MIGVMDRNYHVYIITNKSRSTLYTGMTGNLRQRMEQHAEGQTDGFSKRYRLKYLVYYEEFDNPNDAIHRGKQLKKWNRAWKERLITESNPNWEDFGQG